MKKILLFLLVPLLLTACKKIDYTQVVTYHKDKGPSLAAVTIEEWGDFQCPACGAAYSALKPTFTQYEDRVHFVYRHFPLTSIHPLAFNAATASECAADQDKFWEYHDTLYESQPDLKKKDLLRYAGQLGLDTASFEACFDSHVKNDVVKADMTAGNQKGINSTPTFYFNGEKIENWTTLPQLLAEAFPEVTATSTATTTQ